MTKRSSNVKRSISLIDTTVDSDIIQKLLHLIDIYCSIGAEIRGVILDLARWMDETRQCQQDEICRKIKHILKEKIDQGKISDRWIEESLPQEYKRQYTKTELSSVSKENEQEQVLSIVKKHGAKSITEIEFNAGDSKAIAKNDTNELSQEDIKKYAGILERSLDAIDISKNPLEFSIPRDKYQNLITAMQDSDNAIYAIFKDGIFQYAYPDKAQI